MTPIESETTKDGIPLLWLHLSPVMVCTSANVRWPCRRLSISELFRQIEDMEKEESPSKKKSILELKVMYEAMNPKNKYIIEYFGEFSKETRRKSTKCEPFQVLASKYKKVKDLPDDQVEELGKEDYALWNAYHKADEYCMHCYKPVEDTPMLICDGCELGFHQSPECLGLSKVPADDENFFCRICTFIRNGKPTMDFTPMMKVAASYNKSASFKDFRSVVEIANNILPIADLRPVKKRKISKSQVNQKSSKRPKIVHRKSLKSPPNIKKKVHIESLKKSEIDSLVKRKSYPLKKVEKAKKTFTVPDKLDLEVYLQSILFCNAEEYKTLADLIFNTEKYAWFKEILYPSAVSKAEDDRRNYLLKHSGPSRFWKVSTEAQLMKIDSRFSSELFSLISRAAKLLNKKHVTKADLDMTVISFIGYIVVAEGFVEKLTAKNIREMDKFFEELNILSADKEKFREKYTDFFGKYGLDIREISYPSLEQARLSEDNCSIYYPVRYLLSKTGCKWPTEKPVQLHKRNIANTEAFYSGARAFSISGKDATVRKSKQVVKDSEKKLSKPVEDILVNSKEMIVSPTRPMNIYQKRAEAAKTFKGTFANFQHNNSFNWLEDNFVGKMIGVVMDIPKKQKFSLEQRDKKTLLKFSLIGDKIYLNRSENLRKTALLKAPRLKTLVFPLSDSPDRSVVLNSGKAKNWGVQVCDKDIQAFKLHKRR